MQKCKLWLTITFGSTTAVQIPQRTAQPNDDCPMQTVWSLHKFMACLGFFNWTYTLPAYQYVSKQHPATHAYSWPKLHTTIPAHTYLEFIKTAQDGWLVVSIFSFKFCRMYFTGVCTVKKRFQTVSLQCKVSGKLSKKRPSTCVWLKTFLSFQPIFYLFTCSSSLSHSLGMWGSSRTLLNKERLPKDPLLLFVCHNSATFHFLLTTLHVHNLTLQPSTFFKTTLRVHNLLFLKSCRMAPLSFHSEQIDFLAYMVCTWMCVYGTQNAMYGCGQRFPCTTSRADWPMRTGWSVQQQLMAGKICMTDCSSIVRASHVQKVCQATQTHTHHFVCGANFPLCVQVKLLPFDILLSHPELQQGGHVKQAVA